VTLLADVGIIAHREENLALLLIHNPRLRNALSQEILSQLRAALLKLRQDDRVRALIIGSDVDGAFASGGNIRELQALAGSTGGLRYAESLQSVFRLMEDFPRPVLAAINGYCLGAGAELAMAADMRVAADTALLASPQVGLGITPGLGGGQRLIRLIGPGHAKRLILTAELISAKEALRLGLVELVVPLSELWDVARATARRLANKPRAAVILAKKALNYSSQANLQSGCAYEATQFGLACWGAKSRHSSGRVRDGGECD
jgi:enoyl-CoA hydratase